MYGIDLLGLNHSKVNARMVAKLWPEKVALGVLLDSFTRRPFQWKKLETVLASGKVPRVRAHLINATALRSKLCEGDFFRGVKSPEEFVRKVDPRLEAYIVQSVNLLDSMCQKYGVVAEISPFLEHNFSASTMVSLYERLPFDVNNPMKGIQRGKWLKNETHNGRIQPGANIHSLDGVDAISVRWSRFQEAAKSGKYDTVYLWTHKFNLRNPKWKSFVCPLKREYGFDKDFFQSMVDMLLAVPDTKKRLEVAGFRTTNLGSRSLWKTHDDESQKPVAILPFKNRKGVDVVTFDGRKVGFLKYVSPWEEDRNLHRYYSARGGSGDYAFELSRKAERASGSQCLFLLDTESKLAFRVPHGAQRWGFEYGEKRE